MAYATLTWIPALLVDRSGNNAQSSSSNSSSHEGISHSNINITSTLPSLSWTLVALFIIQTVLGLIQWQLNLSPKSTAVKPSAPSSIFSVLNTSMVIGAVGTLICHVFAVLFGAGIVQQAKETSQLAAYLSLLTFYPASFVLGADAASWLRIFIHSSPRTYTEAAFYCQGMMAIFGAWLGSIVIPLDWDRPWQAWPVPCVLGAFLFYCIGTLVGFVVGVVMRQRAARNEFGVAAKASKQGRKHKTG
ncbi:unnamed protein product [Mortierella alpina]